MHQTTLSALWQPAMPQPRCRLPASILMARRCGGAVSGVLALVALLALIDRRFQQ
jgi:hypothetical protein